MHKGSSHWSCSQPLPMGGEGKFSFNIQEAAKGGEKKVCYYPSLSLGQANTMMVFS